MLLIEKARKTWTQVTVAAWLEQDLLLFSSRRRQSADDNFLTDCNIASSNAMPSHHQTNVSFMFIWPLMTLAADMPSMGDNYESF